MWDMEVHLFGRAVPDARPRFGGGRVYENKRVTDWKQYCQTIFLGTMRDRNLPMLEGPLEVEAIFEMTPPESWSNKKRREAYGTPISKRPDIDNYFKALADAGNRILYNDDGQISKLLVSKYYQPRDRVILKMKEMK